jgi:hypothetical protein
VKKSEMQNLGSSNVKLIWIFGAILFILIVHAPQNVLSKVTSFHNRSIVEKDLSLAIERKEYKVEHVRELLSASSSNSVDDKSCVITYQQEQQTLGNKNIDGANVADTRLLEVISKGFDNTSDVLYLIVSRFKDSCTKSASFPSWKINNGTSDGVFRLKINFDERVMEETDLFLCLQTNSDGHHHHDDLIHLGSSSSFRLTR